MEKTLCRWIPSMTVSILAMLASMSASVAIAGPTRACFAPNMIPFRASAAHTTARQRMRPFPRLLGLKCMSLAETSESTKLRERDANEKIWKVYPEAQPWDANNEWTNGLWSASDEAMDMRIDLRDGGVGTVVEHIEGVSGAFMLHNVLSPEECDQVVKLTESMGYIEYDLVKNTHAAVTWIASKAAVISPLFERCRSSLPEVLPSLDFSRQREITSLNGRLRCYRYQPDGSQTFRKHMDDSFPAQGIDKPGGDTFLWDAADGKEASMLTFLLYLTDDFDGGHTIFHPGDPTLGGTCTIKSPVAVQPVKGSALCFYQTQQLGEEGEKPFCLAPLHEGSILRAKEGGGAGESKYVIRSDVLYKV